MHASIWSTVPFLVVIPIALWTRQVLPGLMLGLLVGAYMLHPTLLGGIQASLTYILKEIGVSDNLRLLVFLYGFGAFVGLVRVTGGVSGFAEWMSQRVKSERGAFAVTWLSSLVTFMAPDFRIITVAPVMERVFSRLKVATEKVAFVIDATSTPVCAVIPIGTAFVGYMVGLIATAGRHQAIPGSPYRLYLLSIPLNFFAIAMILFALYRTFFGREAHPEARAVPQFTEEGHQATDRADEARDANGQRNGRAPRRHAVTNRLRLRVAPQVAYLETAGELAPPIPGLRRARRRGEVRGPGRVAISARQLEAVRQETGKARVDKAPQASEKGKRKHETYPDVIELVAERVRPDTGNLVLPLGLLLVLTLFLTWWDGHSKAPGLFAALVQANAAKAMLEALLCTLLVSVVWYALRRQPLERVLFGVLQGGNEMMGVNVLLILVWAVSAVSTDLGFDTYVERTLGHLIPTSLIAPALFVFGCAISYVVGSSFGTWGILLPLGFSLAATTHTALPLIAGAVFASGTFGGFASPLSDNTVAMATVMRLPVMEYARMKLRASLWVAAACTLAYAAAGFVFR
ncbi:Na+/H+ antiporter NhaC family protein [Alicyclobacillus herbarius]|uniref:Na+/H+ antiporter NhaC family protein n=1 Tax=Alicyclobacillus herbarius TaxID=122960 RepID=UPI0003F7BBE8|nr:Na+/H+ antiporter NhaC family protein [Alicyclobacillus herbarius]